MESSNSHLPERQQNEVQGAETSEHPLDRVSERPSISPPPFQLKADGFDESESESDTVQLHAAEGGFATAAPPPTDNGGNDNPNGLPTQLKEGIESLSGYSMNDVKVNYNSSKPAQLKAHATAQGNEIDVAPGQEEHLPEEAWHVVQQKQGRVQPTMQLETGEEINDNQDLEDEAVSKGAEAMQTKADPSAKKSATPLKNAPAQLSSAAPIQRRVVEAEDRTIANGYDSIIHTPIWHREAEAFETRLGSYASNDARARGAVQAGLQKMKAIFQEAYYDPLANPDAHYTPFGNTTDEAPTSAGQVGNDPDVIRQVVDDVDKDGHAVGDVNLREKMTAFYNGSYFGKGYGGYERLQPSLKKILHELVLEQSDELSTRLGKEDKAEIMQQMDLDEDKLNEFGRTMHSRFRWLMNAGMDARAWAGLGDNNFLFAEDVFGVGNLANETPARLKANREMPYSHSAKRTNDDATQENLAKTPGDYAGMGVPLSGRERAFVDHNRAADGEGPIGDADKLPWREGIAYFHVDETSGWYRWAKEKKGFPVVSAISGTTARMMSAFQWLNTGIDPIEFRLAIMGWMLTSRDHSLYEIMRGAEMIGVKGAEEDTKDAVGMYQHIDPMSEEELRANVARDRMFPHEAAYTDLINSNDEDQGEFMMPGNVGGGAQNLAAAATAKKGAADAVGRDPNINLSHYMAMMTYTGPDHHILNAVLQWFDSEWASYAGSTNKISSHLYHHISMYLDRRWLLQKQANAGPLSAEETAKLTELNGKMIEFPMEILDMLRNHADWQPIFAVFDDHTSSAEDREAQKGVLKTRTGALAQRLKPEAKAHINMLQESLELLPAADGTVYMGTWETYGMHTGNGTSNKTFNYFQSTSRNEATSMQFARSHLGSAVKQPVLYEIALKAGGKGRDIQRFSRIPAEGEILVMPGFSFTVQPTHRQVDGINVHRATET